MLRGNDPFQEHYRWMRVLYVLMALAVAIAFLASQLTGYNERHDALSIGFTLVGLGLDVMMFLAWIGILLIQRRSFKQLCQQRALVLAGESLPQAEQQPVPTTTPMDLPQQVRKRLRRGSPLTIIVMLIIFSMGLALQQLPLLVSNPYTLPDMVFEGMGALFLILIMIFLLGPLLLSATIVVGYYMLPPLDIDDTGITAHYGRYTVKLVWQDIRYFAMSNSKQIAQSKASVKAFMYEICDGENIINWAPNTRNSLTYKVDHPDYNMLAAEQLPALIVARTGLPLLDLRQIK